MFGYIKASAVRKAAREEGKRAGREFLAALDRHVYELVTGACKMFDGHKKTLSAAHLLFQEKGE